MLRADLLYGLPREDRMASRTADRRMPDQSGISFSARISPAKSVRTVRMRNALEVESQVITVFGIQRTGTGERPRAGLPT